MQMKQSKEGSSRIDGIFRTLKSEYTNLEDELGKSLEEKEDYENKLKHQLAEFESLKNTLVDLEHNNDDLKKKIDFLKTRKRKRSAEGDTEEENRAKKRRKFNEKEKPAFIRQLVSVSSSNKPKIYEIPTLVPPTEQPPAFGTLITPKMSSLPDPPMAATTTEEKEHKKAPQPQPQSLPPQPQSQLPPQQPPLSNHVLENTKIAPPPTTTTIAARPIPTVSTPPIVMSGLARFNHNFGIERITNPVNQPTSHIVHEMKESMMKHEGNDWVVVHTNFEQGNFMNNKKNLNVHLKNNFEHDSVVCCVNFSPDGKYLATGSNRRARIFDIESGSVYKTFETRYTHLKSSSNQEKEDSYIRSVCFSPCGNFLAAGTEDRCIKIWDFRSGVLRYSLAGHELDIYCLTFSKNGRYIVSGSGDGKTKVWSMETGRCLLTLGNDDIGPKEGVTSVDVSPDSKILAAGSLDCEIRLWDIENGKFIQDFKGHDDSVYSVSFSPCGYNLASGSLDKTLKVWDLGYSRNNAYRCLQTLTGHRDYVLSVAYSNDGKWLISGSKDRSVQFWDAKTYLLQLMLQGHKNSVINVALNPKGNEFATGSGDFRCRLWGF